MIKIFSEYSFYDFCNKSNTQTTPTPVSLNLFNYTDNSDPFFTKKLKESLTNLLGMI